MDAISRWASSAEPDRAGPERAETDRGSISVFVLGLVLVLMIVAGLVVDGGRAVNARAAIMDDAEQAARAGSNQVDTGSLRAGADLTLDADAARAATVQYLVARGYESGRISTAANESQVTVTVSDDVPTALLSLIFIRSFRVEGFAVARAAAGVDAEIIGGP